MKITYHFIGFFFLTFIYSNAQSQNDSIILQTKIWSRNAHHDIEYSDWKNFPSKIIDLLKGFKPDSDLKKDKFGGNLQDSWKKTGYFYTEKRSNRWWIIDPLGHPFYNLAINGVRLGKAPSNEKAFSEKFQTKENWIATTKKLFDETGFNTSGSWSDLETIKAYNAIAESPIVYTTQLSLLANFVQKKRKKLGNKTYPELAAIFSAEFENYCEEKTRDIADTKNDPNLFGHFSDNELPFHENLLKLFLELNDASDNAFQVATQWIKEHHIDTANIEKEQKQVFSGYVAEKYYSFVSKAIKKNDPNHFYLGSRLHAAAKVNDSILGAAQKYQDIISINYYGEWAITEKHATQWNKLSKPFIITEFYTKGEDSHMGNITGAGWLVKTQLDRGIHYQNFGLKLLQVKNCVGWHWFRYQDNAADDANADFSNKDSNKGLVNTNYETYQPLSEKMKQLNQNIYGLINYFDKH